MWCRRNDETLRKAGFLGWNAGMESAPVRFKTWSFLLTPEPDTGIE